VRHDSGLQVLIEPLDGQLLRLLVRFEVNPKTAVTVKAPLEAGLKPRAG
jgi:hypothetical protein